MITDDKKQVHGKVIDINIYCNNPEILDSHYYAQLKMYYNELHRYANEIVTLLTQYTSQNYTMSYELQKLFAHCKRIIRKIPHDYIESLIQQGYSNNEILQLPSKTYFIE